MLGAILTSLLLFPSAHAADAETAAILAQAGCYKVTYESRETGTYDPNYRIHSGHFRTEAFELVVPDFVSDNKIVLQHITQLGTEAGNHWGQTWKRSPTRVFQYQGDLTWEMKPVVKPNGKWSQYVTQVDGGPRYDCAAAWKINGGVREWECKSWSPVPRREYKRKDYNVLERDNRHIITNTGWVHHQDNRKLLVKGGVVTPIATELTVNTYDRVSDDQCAPAIAHWNNAGASWRVIRSAWDELVASHPRLQFRADVINGKTLWMRLYDVTEAQEKNPVSEAQLKKNARAAINEFLMN